MAKLIQESIVSVSEKLEVNDRCVITDAYKAKENIGTEVHLIQFVPCYWDGDSRVETAFYSFDNRVEDGTWIVSHAVPGCELQYLDAEGNLEYGHLALVKCSHLKLVSKAGPPPAAKPKPIIHCG